jgi:hypothetical protein
MLDIYRLTLAVHIVAGIVGLFAFWTPAIVRKGGNIHVRAGRIFFWCTAAVALSGLAMASLLWVDPLGIKTPGRTFDPHRAEAIMWRIRLHVPFLAYLVLITFAPVYHGRRVLETRRAPDALRTPFHTVLSGLTLAGGVGMLILGIAARMPIFAALSPIGMLIGLGQLGFARKPYPTPMAWWYEHMGAMLGGGIAFHTAFLVLGLQRVVQLEGAIAVVPWLLPTIVGIPASEIWTRYYKRRFREAGVTVPAAAHVGG